VGFEAQGRQARYDEDLERGVSLLGSRRSCLVVHFTYYPADALTHISSSAVVFITSNYIGNSEIMQGCKEAGIPAFGTLWDFVGVTLFSIRRLLVGLTFDK
jgi:hypothetical protein